MTGRGGSPTTYPPDRVTAPVRRPRGDVWCEAAATPEFVALRRRLLRFVVPATVLFLLWFCLYLGLNAWTKDVLSVRVGGLPVVLLLALGQFASTFALTAAYNRYATRRLDPLAAVVRDRLEERAP
ncbi:DUF485 domain-containing protein [Pseudonocardia spirodelae]|uniref:DUF485 domain-containing protein n=1 Tax=Pseudonocardia spirodelae TaxID=3133431 RepID=A0ABU8TDF2_9PSEU